jgi:type IV pilus assembly protein PilQ
MKKCILGSAVFFFSCTLWAQPCIIQSASTAGDNVEVRIKSSEKLKYNSIVSADGRQVIVRVLDCKVSSTFTKSTSGKQNYLQSVKLNKLIDPPLTSIVEVVSFLKKDADFEVSATDNSIKIKLKSPEKKRPSERLIKKDRFAIAKDYYDIMENLPTTSMSFDYSGANVRSVLNIMAARMGVNVVYSRDVSGPVTIRLKNVPFNEAFKTVLRVKGLTAQQIGSKILRIATAKTVEKERETAPLTTKFLPLKYQNAQELKKVIEGIIKAEGRKGKVSVDIQSNALIVTDTSSGIEGIARILAQVDRKPMQVLIETKLVEVNINNAFDLGVEWSSYGGHTSEIGGQRGFNFFGSANTASQAAPVGFTTNGVKTPYTSSTSIFTPLSNIVGSGGTGVSFPTISDAVNVGAFRFGRITDSYLLDITLSAAQKDGKVKILSEPKVTTLNNREAKIDITTQIPYTTSTSTNTNPVVTTTEVVYLDTGIMLEVTPQVNADNRITMKVKPTVSQQASSSVITPAAGGAPGVDTRSAETTVMTRNGETIVIGGLIYDVNSDLIYKVPLLGDIPLLGWLFKKKHNSVQRIELLIFVTPKIVEG